MNDKEKLLRDYARMCLSGNCKLCPIGEASGFSITCSRWVLEHPKEAVEAIEIWAAEHPVKTRQDKFLELYPNARLDIDGNPFILPCDIDCDLRYNSENCTYAAIHNCAKCRYDYWSQEVADE